MTSGPDGSASLEAWVRRHLHRPWFAAWSEADQGALLALTRGVRPLLDAVASEATLVHSDFNPKNLLVDRERAEVTGLLDWSTPMPAAGSPTWATSSGSCPRRTTL